MALTGGQIERVEERSLIEPPRAIGLPVMVERMRKVDVVMREGFGATFAT